MKIEWINSRITIQKNEVMVDRIGNHRNEWQTTYTCYATVSGEAARETSDAGLIVDDSKINFTVRWCKAAAEVTSTNYRILFNGEIYNILGVDHMNYHRKSIKFICEKVRRS